MTQTLPDLIGGRRTVALAAAAAVVVVAGLLLRGGPPTLETARFTIETTGAERAPARGDELLRLRDGRSTLTVRPLTLPAYQGDVAGMLPVYATTTLPPAPDEGRARIGGAPGYRIGSNTILAEDEASRDAVRLSLRGRSRPLRLALRSFEFR